MHLRQGSGALEKQIRDLVREVQVESLKPGFYSFGLGHCKAPKVLEDIVESIAGAIFLDSICGTATVWRVRINVCLRRFLLSILCRSCKKDVSSKQKVWSKKPPKLAIWLLLKCLLMVSRLELL